MKNKLISIITVCVLLITSLITVNAIAPTPRVDLDEYQITTNDKNNVYVTGTVNICIGQNVGVYDSNGKIMYNYSALPNTNKKGSFKLQVPERYLNDGTNTFKIKTTPIRGEINGSNSKTITIIINTGKKDQSITATDITLKVNETKNIGATVTSGLSLAYLIKDPSIATIDSNGNVIGRKEGKTTAIIYQSGNSEYNATNKSINVTVISSEKSKAQTISTSFDSYQFKNTNVSKSLNAKSTSGLPLTYKSSNSKIATVDKNGKITAKKSGKATITISQTGNSEYKALTKNVTVTVPNIKSDIEVSKPILSACQTQAKWMKNFKYGDWRPCTISHSKKHGTCVTYVACVLQRLGYLKSKNYIWQNGRGYGSGKVYGSNSNFNVIYLKNIKVKNAKRKLKSGDIVMFDDNRSGNKGGGGHIFIYAGKYKDNKMLVWDQSSGKSHKCKARYDYKNRKILAVARVKRYKVNTSCTNGTITATSDYLIKQNVTIKYTPMKGKKLKSVKVDGKSLNINKNKNSYTFKNLNTNHNIEVVFN